jgi:membrane protease YdiL (CAAX protease family)
MTDDVINISKDEPIQISFQEALVAIQANQLSTAHRHLLKAVQAEPQNIQVWLLLGWTAPSSTSAAYYFHHLLEQHPDNPLARDILQSLNSKSSQEVTKSESSVSNSKQFIIRSIAYLEKSNTEKHTSGDTPKQVESKISSEKTIKVENRVTHSKVIQVDVHPASIQGRKFGIPKSLQVPLAYLAALALAEALTILAIPQIGLMLHGIILVMLFLHAALFARRGEQKFLFTLTLAPLIRLMSLSMPLLNFPFIYWYVLIGLPLLLAAFLVLRVTGFKADRIGLNGRALPWQIIVGLTGLGLGFLEYIILRPEPLVQALTWQQILLPSLILLLFTGFLEELIFRGLIQRGAAGTVGRYSLIYVATLFAVLHFGYQSILDVVFVFIVALFFGFVVIRTGSLLGVTLSHGLTNIALYLIVPFLMNPAINPISAVQPTQKDTIASPIVWLVKEIDRQQSHTISNNDISDPDTPSWHIETKVGIEQGQNQQEDFDIKVVSKWHPGHMEFGICSLKNNLALPMTTTRSARSTIWYRLVTVE